MKEEKELILSEIDTDNERIDIISVYDSQGDKYLREKIEILLGKGGMKL